jgi:acyl CoA:acetate/3-ketoacid CoA transferase alpha subunit
LDSSFKTGGGANGTVTVIKRLKDGKILIAGTFTTVQGVPRNRIARLLASGKVDLTLNPGTGGE